MDWVKEKKKHDFLDEFEKWINQDEVVTPKRQSCRSSKDNINLRVARNFTLVTDLDMKIDNHSNTAKQKLGTLQSTWTKH